LQDFAGMSQAIRRGGTLACPEKTKFSAIFSI
jgi:hypothetical protein